MLFVSFHLLVNLSHTEDTPHNLLLYIFKNFPWEFAARICRGYLPPEFAAEIFRGNLSREFAAGICHGYLPWVFAVCICKEILFCICEQILFIWKQTLLICGQYFLFVRFSLLIVFLFVIAVAVMCHRRFRFSIYNSKENLWSFMIYGE